MKYSIFKGMLVENIKVEIYNWGHIWNIKKNFNKINLYNLFL